MDRNQKADVAKNVGFSVLCYALMLAISFLPLIVWWREPDRIASGQDITWHRVWVYDLVQGWKNGFSGIVPGHALLGNLGYNVYGFYAPLSHYTVGLLNLMGMRIIDAWKLVGVTSIFVSGIFTYRLGILLLKNRGLALALGIMYILMPYRYTNFLVRAAFPEGVALAWIPLLFLGIFHILRAETPKVGGYVCAVVASAGLVLTHPFTALLSAVLAVCIALANYKDLWRILKQKSTYIFLPISLVLIFGLVAVYYVPMQLALNSGYYRMSDEVAVWTNVEYLIKAEESSWSFSGFLYPDLLSGLTGGPWNESQTSWIWDIVVFVVCVAASVVSLGILRHKGKNKIALPVSVIIALLPIFFRQREEIFIGAGVFAVIMLLVSINDLEPAPTDTTLAQDLKAEAKNPEIYVMVALLIICFMYLFTDFMWIYSPAILRKCQFPFRFWGMMSFLIVMIVMVIARTFRRYRATKYAVAGLALSFYVVTHAVIDKRLSLYNKRYGLTEPDDALVQRQTKMGVMNEYMPLVFYDDSFKSEYPNSLYKTIKNEIRYTHKYQYTAEDYHKPVFLEGSGTISLTSLNSPNAVFAVTVASDEALVQLPQFYYDGYVATLSNESTSYTVKGEYVDGLVSFRVKKGTYVMDVAFKGSTAYQVFRPIFYISIGGVVAFGVAGYVIPKIIQKKKQEKEASAA